jgi:hypothetical protein
MPLTVGSAKTGPVTGLAGRIFTAWTGDGDAGLLADVATVGHAVRNLVGAQLNAIAQGIVDEFVANRGVRARRDVSSAVSVLVTDELLCFTATGAANLPAASVFQHGQQVDVIDVGGSGAVSISPNGSDTINGANAAVAISKPYSTIRLTSDGASAWHATGEF